MTTKNLIPRASGEGGIGITDVTWGYGYYDTGNFNKGLFVSGHNITQVIAETVTQGGLGGEWTKAVNGLDIYYNGGNVGIGTTNPAYPLDVIGTLRVSEAQTWLRSNSNTSATLYVNQEGSNASAVFLGGNVGIGTTSPGARLSVEIGSTTIPSAKFNNLAGDAGSTVHIVESETSSDHFGLFVGDNDTNGAKLTAVLLTKYRNVGIGAINPAGKLHVSDLSESIGNVDVIQGNNQITGTDLNTKLINGDKIRINTSTFTVSSVTATTLTLSSNWPNATINGVEAFKNKELFIVKNNGNVGIGTTSPTNALNVIRSSTSGVPVAWLHNSNNTATGNFGTVVSCINNGASINVFQVRSNNSTHTNGNVLFTVKGDGNVGIGTTSPGAALDVAGSFKLNNTGGGTLYPTSNDVYKNGTTSSLKHSIILNTAGWRNASVIESVTGTTPSNFSTQGLYLNATYGSSVFTSASVHVDCNTGSGDISFLTGTGAAAPTTKFKLQNNGNVGIGTTNPGAQLEVINSTAGLHQFQVKSEHTGSGWGGLSSFIQKNGTLSRSLVVGAYRPEVNVNPCAIVQFESRDAGQAFLWLDDSNVLRLGTSSVHIGSINGTSLGTAGTSDERLKNIEDDFEYGLSHVLQLKPIAFTFKKDAQQVRKLGFGAQTSQSVVPESVYDSGNCIDGYDAHPEHEGMNVAKSDDNELGMEYVQLIPVLTKAIQEQQQLIEDLKSRIETLENK